MEKLKMHSPNLTETNISKIAELFPNCVAESKDEQGNLKLSVDFDQLKQELSDSLVEGPHERYHLDWPGKRQSLLTANAPIAKTLRPIRTESIDFDKTRNMFIEGDNLDSLQLLQETFLGKIKMIYIDPPYNTGHDFIYEDSYAISSNEFLKKSMQKDEIGNVLVSNLDSNGRFHSDWLSMIYPRLKLSRNLLRNDGILFVSIDDNEIENMRKLCNEVFGEKNFIAQVVWEKMYTTKNDSAQLSNCHEYVLVYAKDINEKPIHLLPRTPEMDARYNNPDDDPRGPWKPIPLYAKGERKNGRYAVISPITNKEHWPNPESHWLYSETDTKTLIEENRIYFGKDGNSQPNVKRFLTEVQQGAKAKTLWKHTEVGSNDSAKRELRLLYTNEQIPFDFPKPTLLLKRMLLLSTSSNKNDIVLDYFAGSSTTAHAVMLLNAEDGGNRRFVMIQLPEPCDKNSEAFKLGYSTIADISKERIRRAGTRILDEIKREGKSLRNEELFGSSGSSDTGILDIGFRVLKIDTSTMNDVFYNPDEIDQKKVDLFTENIKADRSNEDLLFQVLLDSGVDLSLPIAQVKVKQLEVFKVDTNALVACFAKKGEITEDICKELAKDKPLRVVFRDAGFKSDAVKINVEQIFKQLSPTTEVRTI